MIGYDCIIWSHKGWNTHHMPAFHCSVITQKSNMFFFLYTWSHKRTWDSNSNIFLIFFKLVSWNTQARMHTHIHTPLCTRLHHESTALLSKLFDPRSRVLSVVPQSEFQRFWDNSNVSRHILGPPRRQRQRWKMPPRSLSLSPSIVPTL